MMQPLRTITALLLLSATPWALRAGEEKEPSSEPIARVPEINERVERAVERGLQWLVKNQNKDGSQKSSYPCAASGLAGLAWLASGSTFHEGRYCRNIQTTLDYVLRCASKNGFISEGGGFGPSGMYGHGYSTQFLAQIHGMIHDESLAARVKDVLTKAVRNIEGSQNKFGGWNSSPNAELTDDGSGAIAVMQITALRTSESAGIQVRAQAIEKAKKYLLAMTNDQGWYAYNWHARGNSSGGSVGLTGAGMYMIGCLGQQNDPKYAKGIKNVMAAIPGRGNNDNSFGGWYAYSLFYSSLAIYQHGGDEWRKWYPALSENLIRTQSADGGWSDSYGGVFVALSVMCLQLPYRYLPMFQDGGAGMEGR